MFHLRQSTTCIVLFLALAAVPTPTLMAQEPNWLQKHKLAHPKTQASLPTQADSRTPQASDGIVTLASVPETWIRNAVFARIPENVSGEALASNQNATARAGNEPPGQSASAAIKLSAFTLKSGEFERPQGSVSMYPSHLAVVTLQPPTLEGAELIRQVSTVENDDSLVLRSEFLAIATQAINLADDYATVSGEEVANQDGESNTPKFSTEQMVGPIADTHSLFSKLEISDRYEAYAAHVPSTRTRNEDFASQLPWTYDTFTWISPVFYYKPLYFEQPNLERYGIGTRRWLQPAASSIHFFGSIPLLPYKVLTQHPCEKYYTLGNNRPGDCVPFQRSTILGQSHVGELFYYWVPGSGY